MESSAVQVKAERKPRSRSSSPEAWSVEQILKEEEALATMQSRVEAMYASIHSLQRHQDSVVQQMKDLEQLSVDLKQMAAKLAAHKMDTKGIDLQQEAIEFQLMSLDDHKCDLMDKEGKEAAEAVQLTKDITAKQAEIQAMRGLVLPKVKADGTLDMRYKTSRLIRRADGGLDMRFKMSQNAVKMGIIVPVAAPEVAVGVA
jgi:hypothetical protein